MDERKNDEPKLYVYDMKWQGAVICTAKNKEEALQKMIAADYIDQTFIDNNIKCYEIKEYDLNDVIITKGDMW